MCTFIQLEDKIHLIHRISKAILVSVHLCSDEVENLKSRSEVLTLNNLTQLADLFDRADLGVTINSYASDIRKLVSSKFQ